MPGPWDQYAKQDQEPKPWETYGKLGGGATFNDQQKPDLSPVMIDGNQKLTQEGRPVFQSQDGDYVTEKTITVTDPRINEGKPTNIPTVFDGRIFSEDEAINVVANAGGIDPITKRTLPSFGSIDEAVKAARQRSESLGARLSEQPIAPPVTPEVMPSERDIDRPPGGVVDTPIQTTKLETTGQSSEGLPEVGNAPELNEMSFPAFFSSLGLLFSGDEEGAKGVLKRQFPDATFTKSAEGDELVNLPSGTYQVRGLGQQAISMIGQGLSFIAPGGMAARATAGAGLAAKAGAQALAAGATQAGIETAETALGGKFDAEDIALAGTVGGASEFVAAAFQVIRHAWKGQGVKAVDDAINAAKPKSPLNNESIKASVEPESSDYEEIGNLLKKGKAKLAAMRARPDKEIKEAADDLGIVLNPGAYSTSRAFQEIEQILKSIPGSKISTREANAITALGQRSDELINRIGGTRDISLLDNTLKNEIWENIDNLEKQASKAYKSVDDIVPKTLKVEPRSSREYITARLKELGGDESLLSSAEKQLLRFTKQDTPPTYAALDRVRKNVGQGFTGKGIFKDDETGILNQVYRVLSTDQQGVAEAVGAGAEYAAGRKLVQTRKALEDEAVALFGRNFNQSIVPKFTGAATALTKGDVSKLSNLMAAVPEHRRQEVAASMLSELFTSGARAQKEGVGQGFVNAYANLNRNKLAKDAIFKYLPKDSRERFDKIGKVATGLFRAKNLENTSKTARDVIFAMDNGGLFSRAYDFGRKVAVAEGATTAAGLPGVGAAGVLGAALAKGKAKPTQAADELLTSKAFEKAMIKAMNNAEKEAEEIITKSQAFRNWIKHADRDTVSQITRSGFIPWITGQEGQEDEQ